MILIWFYRLKTLSTSHVVVCPIVYSMFKTLIEFRIDLKQPA
jgi:hypothetical protein